VRGGLRVLAVDDEVPAVGELAHLLRKDPRVAKVFTSSEAGTPPAAATPGHFAKYDRPR